MTTHRGASHNESSNSFFHNARSIGSFADHEPGLWRAVITQALMDAASRSSKPEHKRARHDALHWLLSATSDFEIVCDHAGLDPSYVRDRARQALARRCEWRLPAGQGWRTQAARMATMASNVPAPQQQ